jgi:hypothetical protein
MRRTGALLSCLVVTVLAGVALSGVVPAGAAPRAKSVDECRLLTTKQAEVIMRTEPFGRGAPDNDGCSWQTDPTDRANLAYVTVTVLPLAKYLRDSPDVRTFLDETTTVGIDDLPGVGSEAYSTYSGLTGPGASDGITVRVGKQVMSIGFQPAERIENPSAEFDRVVTIVEKMVAKLKRS